MARYAKLEPIDGDTSEIDSVALDRCTVARSFTSCSEMKQRPRDLLDFPLSSDCQRHYIGSQSLGMLISPFSTFSFLYDYEIGEETQLRKK